MQPRSRIPLVAGLCISLATGVAPVRGVAAPAATERSPDPFEAGLRAYERKAFSEAISLFEEAYAREPKPVILYAWAQAAREAGDCRHAIKLYRDFLATGVQGEAAAAARENIGRCEQETPAVPPSETAEPSETDEPVAQPPPASAAIVTPRSDAELHSTRKRRPSPLGITLVTLGGLGAMAGGTLLVLGETRRASQSNADSETQFDALDRSIDRLHISGGVVLGVGVGLLVGGIVKLALSRRQRSLASRPEWGGNPAASLERSWARRLR